MTFNDYDSEKFYLWKVKIINLLFSFIDKRAEQPVKPAEKAPQMQSPLPTALLSKPQGSLPFYSSTHGLSGRQAAASLPLEIPHQ